MGKLFKKLLKKLLNFWKKLLKKALLKNLKAFLAKKQKLLKKTST
jgi:hypothetical protein